MNSLIQLKGQLTPRRNPSHGGGSNLTANTEVKVEKLQNIIFRETTTIGIRYRYENRTELERESIELDTKFGKIKAKRLMFRNTRKKKRL